MVSFKTKIEKIYASLKGKKYQQGFSLITVVFVMLAMSVIGLSLSALISTRAQASVADLQGQQSLYVADGVLQYVLQRYFQGDTDYSNNSAPTVAPYATTSPAPISFNGGQAWVQYSSQTSWSTTITVTAKVGNSIRQIQQRVTQSLPYGKSAFAQGDITITGDPLVPLICAPSNWGLCSGYAAGDFGANGAITNPTHFAFNTWLGGNRAKTPNMQVALPQIRVDPLKPILLPASATNPPHEYTGDITVGPGILGTVGTPYNVHSTGNINIAQNTIIVGNVVSEQNVTMNQNIGVSGTIAAKGTIQGDVSPSGAIGEGFFSRPGPSGEILPAMIAEGDVTLNTQGIGLMIDGMIISGDDVTFQSNTTVLGTGQALILSGPLMANGDISIANDRGFTVLGYDSAEFSAFSQAGSFKLDYWKEV